MTTHRHAVEYTDKTAKSVKVSGLSKVYNNKALYQNEDGVWSVMVDLEKGIYLYQFYTDGRYDYDHSKQTVQYYNRHWNVLIVEYNYSVGVVQKLYNIFDYRKKNLCDEDLDLFLRGHSDFSVDTKLNYYIGGMMGLGTILHFATRFNCNHTIRTLLDKGVNNSVTFENTKLDGLTGLEIAKLENNTNAINEFYLNIALQFHQPGNWKLIDNQLKRVIFSLFLLKEKNTALAPLPKEILTDVFYYITLYQTNQEHLPPLPRHTPYRK